MMVSEQQKQADRHVSQYMESDSTSKMLAFFEEWRSSDTDRQQLIVLGLSNYLDSPKPAYLKYSGGPYCRQWEKEGSNFPHPKGGCGGHFISQDICREDGRAAYAIATFLCLDVGELHNGVVGKDLDNAVRNVKKIAKRFTDFSVESEFQLLINADSYSKLVALTSEWKQRSLPAQRALVEELLSHLKNPKHIGLANPEGMKVKSRMEKTQSGDDVIDQDVLIIGGRCAWALELMLETSLPVVREGQEAGELDSAVDTAIKKFDRSGKLSLHHWYPFVNQ